VHVGDAHVINLCKKLPYLLKRGFSVITYELGWIRYPETPWIRNRVIVFWIRLLIGPSLTFWCKPELPQSPSDLIPNPIIYLTLYPQVRSNISRCPKEKYVGNRTVMNTRTCGRYVGTVRYGLVIWLLNVWVWIGWCGVSRKTQVTRSGCAPRVR
jgi:hypothetical protein